METIFIHQISIDRAKAKVFRKPLRPGTLHPSSLVGRVFGTSDPKGVMERPPWALDPSCQRKILHLSFRFQSSEPSQTCRPSSMSWLPIRPRVPTPPLLRPPGHADRGFAAPNRAEELLPASVARKRERRQIDHLVPLKGTEDRRPAMTCRVGSCWVSAVWFMVYALWCQCSVGELSLACAGLVLWFMGFSCNEVTSSVSCHLLVPVCL